VATADWEERCYAAGCAVARELAQGLLGALEAWLHLTRPRGYRVEGFRTRVLVTRMGDLRVRRRLYRAPDGSARWLLDAHLGWLPRQAVTPSVLALLVDWATDVPFADAATKLAAATAGVLSGPTVRRQLRRVAARVQAAEVATHATWATSGRVPAPAGARVVTPLYVEADGVHVKTQREPAHRGGYELKCASAYEGWERLAEPTPGHPRPHYALVAKQVYCHAHATRGPDAIPFWEGASLALHRTYDLARLALVVVGGDGANWLDTAAEVFARVARQRDGFHLARDAARGWGPATGAQLYEALRTGDQPTALELLAVPAAPPARLALPAPPARLALPPPPAAPTLAPRPRRGGPTGRAPRSAAPAPRCGGRSPRRMAAPTGAPRCPPRRSRRGPARWAPRRAPTRTCWRAA
jgi:hypothetical protein